MKSEYQKANDAALKKLISQLKGSKEEQLDFLSNERKKRTDELRKEDPKIDIQNHPELDAYGMLYQAIANDKDPKLAYEFNDDDSEIVNDKSLDAIKDNFTPPGAKDEDEYELYDQMESMGDLPSDMQLHKALKKADTNDNGKIEVDEMADFQKSLDDYASKNKKGRDDIPVTTRR